VHGFVQSSAGRISIESRPGAGTTVELLLPRSLAPPSPVAPPAPSALAGEGAALHVLIVEDSDAVATLLEEMVAQLGHRVSRVSSAPAALHAIEQAAPPDLVLSDVMMPGGMSGIELAQELRRRHRHLPVVLASGRADTVRLAARDAAVPLLGKPFEMRELAAAIAEARAGSDHMTEKPCILVLEDEMIIAMFAEMALEEIGCTVVGPVGRVDEALALLEGGRVDAALLDLNLGRGTTSCRWRRPWRRGTFPSPTCRATPATRSRRKTAIARGCRSPSPARSCRRRWPRCSPSAGAATRAP
jgi:CheY-like chemotaxis protein